MITLEKKRFGNGHWNYDKCFLIFEKPSSVVLKNDTYFVWHQMQQHESLDGSYEYFSST